MVDTLVTGGSGLVGTQINADSKVGSSWDLRDPKTSDTLIKEHNPINVIHCAGKVGGLGGNMSKKGEFFYDNIMINTNLIESCRKYGVKNLAIFLSTCVFPDNAKYPLTTEQIHNGEPHHSNYPYAYAKRMADVQLRAYREQYGLEYISLIPTNIYGPGDNFNLADGHVIPSLIHKCYLAKKNNTDFEVWGSGKPLREFIYSEDVGKIAEWAVKNYKGEEPLIISTSQEISIKELVYLIVDIFDFDGYAKWLGDKPDGQFRKPSDNSLLISLLPEFKFTPIREGLFKTIKWFKENYKEVRK